MTRATSYSSPMQPDERAALLDAVRALDAARAALALLRARDDKRRVIADDDLRVRIAYAHVREVEAEKARNDCMRAVAAAITTRSGGRHQGRANRWHPTGVAAIAEVVGMSRPRASQIVHQIGGVK